MRLKELSIDRNSYQEDAPLRGFITLGDNQGEHKIVLSPLEIYNIILVITDTISERAVISAETVASALTTSQDEQILLNNTGELS